MAEGEFALVREYMEVALDKSANANPRGAPTGDPDLYAMLADAATQQRDEAALRKYAPRAEETATRIDHKLYIAIAHRAWGVAHCLAGEYVDAERRLNLALEIFQELDTRWQIGRTLFEFGELSRAQGNATAARDYFSRALIAFEEMRAAPDVARTRLALEQMTDESLRANLLQRAVAEIPPKQILSPRQTTKKEFGGLTEREREVAKGIAQGETNREIAEKLVVSERTVETHVGNILNKLGLGKRAQIRKWAIEKGLVKRVE